MNHDICSQCGEATSSEQWEYLHYFVRARVDTGKVVTKAKGGYFTVEGEKLQSEYAPEAVTSELQHLGSHGWELIAAEPHWSWYVSPQAAAFFGSFSYPSHLHGFYCVFKRAKRSHG